MKENLGKYVWGLAFVLLGLLLLCNSFDLFHFTIFFKGWWTLFIIIPALIDLITKEEKLSSSFFLVLGLALFCASNDYIGYGDVFTIFLCLAFILMGLKIMFRSDKPTKFKRSASLPNYTGIFGACEEKCNTDYKGGSAMAIFGGVDLDLTDVKLKDDIHIDVFCMFGEITLKTDGNIEIISSTFNVFGGTENKNKSKSKGKKIYIDGFCMFGGIEIK